MRLFLVDPGLFTVHGHHASYDRSVSSAARALGIEVHVFCNREASEAALAELSAVRAFSHSPYTFPLLPDGAPLELFFTALKAKTAAFQHELATVVTPRMSPDDVVFAHTVFIPELQALVLWYRDLPAAQRPRLAVMLRFEPETGFIFTEMPEPSTSAHRELVGQLEEMASPERLAIVTDTPMLTSAYRSLTGSERIRTLPTPIPPRPRPAMRAERSAFAYVGEVAPDKGFGIALEATRLVAARRPEIRFRFQSGRTPMPPEQQAQYPNIEFLGGGLNDAEYFALIDSSIAVLTLYNPTHYRNRSSGVFTDAVTRGTMAISTRCSISGYLEQMDCSFLLVEGWTAQAAAQKIIEVYDRKADYGERFRVASQWLAAYHRADRFVAELMGCFSLPV